MGSKERVAGRCPGLDELGAGLAEPVLRSPWVGGEELAPAALHGVAGREQVRARPQGGDGGESQEHADERDRDGDDHGPPRHPAIALHALLHADPGSDGPLRRLLRSRSVLFVHCLRLLLKRPSREAPAGGRGVQ